ncbi:class I SAM-dependent methyltransferase [Kitasatospora sp. GP82]|uniref:class I SAM-dependent methyltransferase n=1 Tax=Kitasatospora sp. GP82 TaxID=3035089 RepID=UPI002474C81F|nr:class I SAM-dependent methyltransferase [Kitasatospora sp. GP82]MDH6127681.1 SAM-dependent methyltransferase [Kitasatospora sp. GP82]
MDTGTGPRPAGAVGYRELAGQLAVQYESVGFEEVHEQVLHLLPVAPVRVLDVGAGTGRDAAALASRGHSVLAVEPTVELRVHTGGGIAWLADSLPELSSVEGEFALIMLTAVWMHLDPSERRRAMARIASLLAPGGRVMMLLRHGPVPQGRRMFAVSGDETAVLAGEFGLAETHRGGRGDRHARAEVEWTHLVLDLKSA